MLGLARRGEPVATIIESSGWELVEDAARQTQGPGYDDNLGVVLVGAWLETNSTICHYDERILRMARNRGPGDELAEQATFWCEPKPRVQQPTIPTYVLGAEVYASGPSP